MRVDELMRCKEKGSRVRALDPFQQINSSTHQLLLQRQVETTLVSAGGVAMNEALPSCAVEQLDRALLVRGGRGGPAGLLQGSTQCGALSAVTDRGCLGLPKVLGRRCNSWQGKRSK